ncbi:ATP-dependent RNA helicase RhlE [Ereboglobus sp. PH5-5]|uniref:DEAD/DEAH box helicase n=1 Tax=unclassified Ereboglobus TaxID=2626932 RepID=UPI0024076F23|nr:MULTISPECIES: DEAD/DEAH box helicase [unclassified Ereboglobus]MDF9827008.1 ATP-dependent RNA helicase RhlE [Ereboglobus sp. PH5-10]MDF9832030.1 ATP-dependent RNA helicase RhlE [Ereboglobus sp. PH5-5]
MPFKQLGLPDSLVRGAQTMGYAQPTPIQQRAIPVVLDGRDLIGSAQTGTGKTAAFALPILARLGAHRPGPPRVLVLEPTRELAAQVETAFRELGRFTNLRVAVIHGGVGYGNQRAAIRNGTDILIATTGRLLDFLQEKTLSLAGIEALVLDEVDRMLDMGFIHDVRRVVAQCPPKRQTLFFSATIQPEIEAVAKFALHDPERVEIGRSRSVVETVTHATYPVLHEQKFDMLLAILNRTDFQSVIIFSRTKHGADRIARKLKSAGHTTAVLHANRSQNQRTEALAGFKDGRYEVLVATDIAARGIDVSGVSHVINFDVPEKPDDYVHRIGRTGRAQADGDAFMLVTPEEAGDLRDIERFIGARIERLALDGFAYANGAPPHIDTSRPMKNPRRKQGGGQQHQRGGGNGGLSKGARGQNQSRSSSGRPHGGGNPSHHPKGKPGGHWRRGGR